MKAAFQTGIRSFEIREIPAPQLVNPAHVLLRIEQVGVCGSDIHYYTTGEVSGRPLEFPLSIGHECSATIVGAGQ